MNLTITKTPRTQSTIEGPQARPSKQQPGHKYVCPIENEIVRLMIDHAPSVPDRIANVEITPMKKINQLSYV